MDIQYSGLNPCYNGIVMYENLKSVYQMAEGLNPCYNGIVMYTFIAHRESFNVES